MVADSDTHLDGGVRAAGVEGCFRSLMQALAETLGVTCAISVLAGLAQRAGS